ncbi:MAG: FAD-dependent oxidoreductase, partial [Actinomycetota bacterium]
PPDFPPPDVLIVDKGRSVGGRLATRRLGGATLDHGAQFFTVRSAAFQTAVDGWLADGVVEEWCRGFSAEDGYPRYRAVGGMNQLAKHLAAELNAAGLSVVTRQRVAAIIPGPDHWSLTYEGYTREPDEAAALIATPPVPQTIELLRDGATVLPAPVADQLAAMAYHRVIAILAVLDRSPGLGGPGALQQPDDPTFTFVSDNQAKGISGEPGVTFHLSHDLSARLWDNEDALVLAEVEPAIRQLLGDAAVTEIQVKRWRYAGPANPHPELSLTAATSPGPLILAGDGFGDSKVEGAFLSGLNAAEEILATQTTT